MRSVLLLATIGLLGEAGASMRWCLAQQPTTVQLPTFSSFTVQTTVVVPDSGAGYRQGQIPRSFQRPMVQRRSAASPRIPMVAKAEPPAQRKARLAEYLAHERDTARALIAGIAHQRQRSAQRRAAQTQTD